jgi:hypothetical protein
MSNRSSHTFQFSGRAISEAARVESDYRLSRAKWWAGEYEAAVGKAQQAGLRVEKYQITGGTRAQMVIDPTLQARISECESKRSEHQRMGDQLAIEAATYATQPDRMYELNSEDVMHWRLAGGERPA